MSRRGTGTIYNGRCHYCNVRVRGEFQQGSSIGHEYGDLLFCTECWKKFPRYIQHRCTKEKIDKMGEKP